MDVFVRGKARGRSAVAAWTNGARGARGRGRGFGEEVFC